MAPKDLRDSLSVKPFEPFRMVLSDGTAYDITHPDLIWVGQHTSMVGFASSPESPFFESSVKVANVHIVKLELLGKASEMGNGQA